MVNQLFVVAVFASFIVSSIARTQDVEGKSYPVLSGVGIALTAKDGHLYTGKLLPKSPAEESGLVKEGSRLVSVEINGETFPLDGKSVGDAASLIRGLVGTKLVLTLVPPSL